MKKVFLWASVILVCYFASDAARVPSSTLLAAGPRSHAHDQQITGDEMNYLTSGLTTFFAIAFGAEGHPNR